MRPFSYRTYIFALGVALMMLGAATGVDTVVGLALPINKLFVEESKEIAFAASVGQIMVGIALILISVEASPRKRK